MRSTTLTTGMALLAAAAVVLAACALLGRRALPLAGRVLAEGDQQRPQGVVRQAVPPHRVAERDPHRVVGGIAREGTIEPRLHRVQRCQAVLGAALALVGVIVAGAREGIHRGHRPAHRGRQQSRGHGEVLVVRTGARHAGRVGVRDVHGPVLESGA